MWSWWQRLLRRVVHVDRFGIFEGSDGGSLNAKMSLKNFLVAPLAMHHTVFLTESRLNTTAPSHARRATPLLATQ